MNAHDQASGPRYRATRSFCLAFAWHPASAADPAPPLLAAGILTDPLAGPQYIAGGPEARTIRETFLAMEEREADQILVTHSGRTTGLPGLMRRAIAQAIPLPRWLPPDCRLPWLVHLDVGERWAAGAPPPHASLDEIATACGLPDALPDPPDCGALMLSDPAASQAELARQLRILRTLARRFLDR